jgi:hypothetical protein
MGEMPAANPTPDAIGQQLTLLRNGLLRLHKRLLDSEAAYYDHEVHRIESPGQLLDLALNHPAFAWLRELSQLIVRIDETIDSRDPVTTAEAGMLIRTTRALLSPAEFGEGFQRRYFEAFQRDPDAVIAHSEMIKVLTEIARLSPAA